MTTETVEAVASAVEKKVETIIGQEEDKDIEVKATEVTVEAKVTNVDSHASN